MQSKVFVSLSPLDVILDAEERKTNISYTEIPGWVAVLLSPVLGGLFVALFPVTIFLSLGLVSWHVFKGAVAEQQKLLVMQGRPAESLLHREAESQSGGEDELSYLEGPVETAKEEEEGGDASKA